MGFHPTSISDLLQPWALTKIETWCAEQIGFLLDCESKGKEAIRTSNQCLALGANAWLPEAYGTVWDLRGLADGVIVPQDFDTPLDSHLNLPLLESELADHPDQE